ncbi:MAG TPA: ATPase, T2SS/T4P/T4SS family [Gemmatimonadaceae bacterium]|nr:ATPase, T2SS/T4P/T4SS family [Gemmatimonadaceae bacterium]
MAVRRWLGDTLLEAGLVTRQQLDEALAVQNTTGQKLGQTLVSLGYLTDASLLQTLCTDAGVPYLTDDELQPQADATALIPIELARSHVVVPLKLESRHLVIAMADPFDLLTIRALTRAAGRSVRVVGAQREAVLRAIEKVYSGAAVASRGAAVPKAAVAGASSSPVPTTPPPASTAPPPPKLELSRGTDMGSPGARTFQRPGWPAQSSAPTGDEGTAAAVVDDIIRRGVDLGATDIHIEPLDDVIRVRYRIDGLLTDGPTFPKSSQLALISRVKILATLDIADSRLPQDGRVRLRFGARSVDLRVSTFPTLHGEDIVLRILDRGRVELQLEKLGVEPDDLMLLRSALQKPFGLIPVTGPTGSGKTTTLYAALTELNTGDRAIITLEDPIEYEIPSIRQSQVNVRAGLTFASGLRSILRHDPNVILVGEIRDEETMQIALSAALTGHLVLTTLHTTTAAGTIPRLLDMGAEPFVVASAVSMFVSQRLVRVLCSNCKARSDVPLAVRKRFGLDDAVLYAPKGCQLCRGTGYKGRLGIFELLPMSPDIVTAIEQRAQPDQIHRDSGRPTLLQDGMRKVRAGLTTLDEILRVTN